MWDRLAGSFALREDPGSIHMGLDGYDDDRWQSVAGMLKTPLRRREDG